MAREREHLHREPPIRANPSPAGSAQTRRAVQGDPIRSRVVRHRRRRRRGPAPRRDHALLPLLRAPLAAHAGIRHGLRAHPHRRRRQTRMVHRRVRSRNDPRVPRPAGRRRRRVDRGVRCPPG